MELDKYNTYRGTLIRIANRVDHKLEITGFTGADYFFNEDCCERGIYRVFDNKNNRDKLHYEIGFELKEGELENVFINPVSDLAKMLLNQKTIDSIIKTEFIKKV